MWLRCPLQAPAAVSKGVQLRFVLDQQSVDALAPMWLSPAVMPALDSLPGAPPLTPPPASPSPHRLAGHSQASHLDAAAAGHTPRRNSPDSRDRAGSRLRAANVVIRAARYRIRSIVTNLVSNAVKFSEVGEEVVVAVTVAPFIEPPPAPRPRYRCAAACCSRADAACACVRRRCCVHGSALRGWPDPPDRSARIHPSSAAQRHAAQLSPQSLDLPGLPRRRAVELAAAEFEAARVLQLAGGAALSPSQQAALTARGLRNGSADATGSATESPSVSSPSTVLVRPAPSLPPAAPTPVGRSESSNRSPGRPSPVPGGGCPPAAHRLRISIAVRDRGVGIGAEDLTNLFQPFVQIKAGQQQGGMGTGLGLAIAKKLAQLHGGDITVESTEGHGSTFTFTFVADVCLAANGGSGSTDGSRLPRTSARGYAALPAGSPSADGHVPSPSSPPPLATRPFAALHTARPAAGVGLGLPPLRTRPPGELRGGAAATFGPLAASTDLTSTSVAAASQPARRSIDALPPVVAAQWPRTAAPSPVDDVGPACAVSDARSSDASDRSGARNTARTPPTLFAASKRSGAQRWRADVAATSDPASAPAASSHSLAGNSAGTLTLLQGVPVSAERLHMSAESVSGGAVAADAAAAGTHPLDGVVVAPASGLLAPDQEAAHAGSPQAATGRTGGTLARVLTGGSPHTLGQQPPHEQPQAWASAAAPARDSPALTATGTSQPVFLPGSAVMAGSSAAGSAAGAPSAGDLCGVHSMHRSTPPLGPAPATVPDHAVATGGDRRPRLSLDRIGAASAAAAVAVFTPRAGQGDPLSAPLAGGSPARYLAAARSPLHRVSGLTPRGVPSAVDAGAGAAGAGTGSGSDASGTQLASPRQLVRNNAATALRLQHTRSQPQQHAPHPFAPALDGVAGAPSPSLFASPSGSPGASPLGRSGLSPGLHGGAPTLAGPGSAHSSRVAMVLASKGGSSSGSGSRGATLSPSGAGSALESGAGSPKPAASASGGSLWHAKQSAGAASPSLGSVASVGVAEMAASLKTLGLRALVVDDSDMNRLMLTRLLRGLGIACDAAEHGAVAVAKMEEATSAGSPPDLITMDRSMPVMDGMDATRRIRGAPIGYAGLVVGITGDANRGDQDDFLRSGVDVVLPKPLIKADLVRLLHGRFALPPLTPPPAPAT